MSTQVQTRRPHVVLRVGRGVSFRVDRRVAVTFVVTGLFAVFAVGFTLAIGEDPVPFSQVVKALGDGASPYYQLIVGVLRLPRVLVAVLIGSCLGMSGAIFQSISRNPLVSPDIIGINSGASAAIVVAVVIGHAGQPPALFGLVGSLSMAVLIYVLSISRHGISRYRMVLIGVGVQAAMGSVITFILTRASMDQLATIQLYLIGDVSSAVPRTVIQLVIPAVILMTAGTLLGSQLEMLQLGDSVAAGLGAKIHHSRSALIFVGVGLAAVSVAAAGPVGFVAFISPHIARGLARHSGNGILPVSAAVGGALTVVADYVGQRILEPNQLPVGIITVIIGGPYFLYLLLKAARTYAL